MVDYKHKKRVDRIKVCTSKLYALDLIYLWCKQGIITKRQFRELIRISEKL